MEEDGGKKVGTSERCKRIGKKFRCFISSIEPPGNGVSFRINSARVFLGHKTSRYQTSIANDIFVFRRNFFYLSPASPLLVTLFALLSLSLSSSILPFYHPPCSSENTTVPDALSLRFVFHETVRRRLFLSRFRPLCFLFFSPPTSFSIFRALGLSFPFLKINGQSDRLYVPEMKLLQVRGLFLLERYLAIYISCVVGNYTKCICDVMSFRRHLVPGELQFQSCNGA